MLSYVAESEYRTIHQRQAEGIAAAKARGYKFGRQPKQLPENFHDVYQKLSQYDIKFAHVSRKGLTRMIMKFILTEIFGGTDRT